ncbi:MAG: LuxR C-terminal-related transcriptional regulator [Actinomycetota bacterium]
MSGGGAIGTGGEWPWIDRGEPQRRLGAALRRDRPLALVSGPLGIGKSALVDRTLTVSRSARRHRVVRVRGRFSDRPYGALIPLLPVGVEPAPTEWQFGQQIRRLVSDPSTDLRCLLVVDDVHLLDRQSMAVVISLVEDDGCGLIAISEPPGPVELLVALTEIVVPPLEDDAIESMIEARIGALDGRSLRAIVGRVEGSPLAARELVDGALDDGRFVERSGVAVADLSGSEMGSLERVVRRRRSLLDTDADETLDLLAFVDTALPLDAFDNAGLVDLDERGWLDRRARRITLPLDLIRTTSPRDDRELAQLAVEAVERSGCSVDRAELVRWEVLAGRTVGDELLLEAATTLARRWRLEEACELVAALSAPTIEGRLLLADLVARSGDLHGAHRALQEAAEDASTPRAIGLTAAHLGEFVAFRLGDPVGGLVIARDALRRIDEPSVFVELATREVVLAVFAGDLEAADATRRAVAEIGPAADALARARFLSNASYLDVMSGDLDADPAVEAAARVLDRVEGDHTAQVARKRLLLTEHLRLIHGGELFNAAALVDAELANECIGASTRGCWLVTRGDVQRLSGRLEEARRSVVSALEYLALDDDIGMADVARADLLGLLAELGDLRPTDGALTAAAELDPRLAARLARSEVRRLIDGRDDAAAEAAARSATAGFVVWAAEITFEAIRLGPAPRSTALLRELASEVGGPLTETMLAVGEATLDGDLLAVHECASTLFDMGYAAYGADAVGLALQMSTASGQRLLTPLLERARVVAAELPRLWPTFGEPVVPPVDGLTGREREIVELAADGRTSKDIARELGISPRTVDNHLGSAYRKLGIGSRHDLSRSDRHA